MSFLVVFVVWAMALLLAFAGWMVCTMLLIRNLDQRLRAVENVLIRSQTVESKH